MSGIDSILTIDQQSFLVLSPIIITLQTKQDRGFGVSHWAVLSGSQRCGVARILGWERRASRIDCTTCHYQESASSVGDEGQRRRRRQLRFRTLTHTFTCYTARRFDETTHNLTDSHLSIAERELQRCCTSDISSHSRRWDFWRETWSTCVFLKNWFYCYGGFLL